MKKDEKGMECRDMKCRDMLAKLSEYIDGELDPRLCRDVERHMKDCHPCLLFVDSLKKTVTFYKYAADESMPTEVHIRLHEYLKKKSAEET
jgi:anti-sigma factor RsiW